MKKLLAVVSVFGVMMAFAACEGGNSTTSAVTAAPAVSDANPTGLAACPSGQANPSGIPKEGCRSGSFPDVCKQMNGTMINGGVCRLTIDFGTRSFSNNGTLDVLNTADSMNFARATGITVYRGDVVRVEKVSGGWGTDGTCDEYAVGSMTNGVETELMATEGTGMYPVTSIDHLSANLMIAGNGPLLMGLNIPDSLNSDGCDSVTIADISVQRCLDASNNSYSCQ